VEATGTDPAAVATLDAGLRFRVEGPNGSVATDMATAMGGGGTANSPGWLMRAALAACDASSIAMEATREGVELNALEVTVESESDARGMLGEDDSVPPGPAIVRTRIVLAADGAGADELRAIVERALGRSPVKDALERAVESTTEVVVR
jgi:uncharacterized OsmC-like protein